LAVRGPLVARQQATLALERPVLAQLVLERLALERPVLAQLVLAQLALAQLVPPRVKLEEPKEGVTAQPARELSAPTQQAGTAELV
jgi:hypothetical protein